MKAESLNLENNTSDAHEVVYDDRKFQVEVDENGRISQARHKARVRTIEGEYTGDIVVMGATNKDLTEESIPATVGTNKTYDTIAFRYRTFADNDAISHPHAVGEVQFLDNGEMVGQSRFKIDGENHVVENSPLDGFSNELKSVLNGDDSSMYYAQEMIGKTVSEVEQEQSEMQQYHEQESGSGINDLSAMADKFDPEKAKREKLGRQILSSNNYNLPKE